MGKGKYTYGKYGGKDRTVHFVVVATASDGTIAILQLDKETKTEAYKEAKAIYKETKLKDVIPAAEFQATTQLNAQTASAQPQDNLKKLRQRVRNRKK